MRQATLRFALREEIMKPMQFLADNVFFYGTPKTVEAHFKDGNFTWPDIEKFLARVKDPIFAEALKARIDELTKVKP